MMIPGIGGLVTRYLAELLKGSASLGALKTAKPGDTVDLDIPDITLRIGGVKIHIVALRCRVAKHQAP